MGSRFVQAQRLHGVTRKRPFSEVVSLHGPTVLRVLGGLPYAEVAAVMGGSTDAARRAAADGITKLRKARAASADLDQTQ